jgi:hypothetical protein
MTAHLLLPGSATPDQRALRARTLFAQREAYQWVHAPGQPPFCRGIPEGESFGKMKQVRLKLDLAESVANLAIAAVRRLRGGNDTIASFKRYYSLPAMPDVARRWASDREFARQRLDGINPLLIRRADEIPESFPVTEATVEGLLPAGTTLAGLLDRRRLFIQDYGAIAGLPKVFGRFQTAPIALFWVDDQRRLMPLAIQLGQSPAEAPIIFTPKDEHWVWLTARAHVQCADGTYHEIVAHLARTHLFVETFWVATCRALPAQHPIYALLRPHFEGTIAINNAARNTLIAPGGPIDESIAVGSEGSLTLVAREYANWTFQDFDPVAQIEARGVGDADLLPGYHYRDDALALYQVIRTYVHDLLRIFYPSDEEVRADEELQDWVATLAADEGGRVKGLPLSDHKLQRFEDLHLIIARLLFVCSVEHAAVNNGQYDQFGYIPNTPGAMFLPPPEDRTPRSEANFVYALPPPYAVGQQLTLVHLLSERTETPLGTYPDDFFQGVPRAQAAVDRFSDDLAQVGLRIAERNRSLEVPYRYLAPHLVARSINV